MVIKIMQTTPDHRREFPGQNFYATVDGYNVGDNDTMWYETKKEAYEVAARYVERRLTHGH